MILISWIWRPRAAVVLVAGVLLAGVVASVCHSVATASELSSFLAAVESIRTDDARKHVSVLASDTFEGREAGSRGGKAASIYLAKQLRKYELAGGGTNKQYFQEFDHEYVNEFRNVIGLLRGSDPELSQEFIVVGAHYDHVGYGNQTNSQGPIGYIHNGADDNASGTSGLLEVIEAFTSLELPPKRSILFTFWDAEERGLLGSKYWTANPTVPLKQIKLAVNADMIGRLRKNRLFVFGTRTGRGLRRFVAEQNRGVGLLTDFTWEMKADSDHHPFFERNIPSLMLHTGKHSDYHRPSDDIDKVNFDGVRQVSRLLFHIAYHAANTPDLPAFRPDSLQETVAQQKQLEWPLPPPAMRFGVAWDSELSEKRIIELTGIDRGSAADRAGLRIGDRIVRFGSHAVHQTEDFRTLVVTATNPVPVVVKRPGADKPLELKVNLTGEASRIGVVWRDDEAEPGCVILRRVIAASPADAAGLKANDRIIGVAGRRVVNSDDFHRLLTTGKSPIKVVFERSGQFQTAEIRPIDEPKQRSSVSSKPVN